MTNTTETKGYTPNFSAMIAGVAKAAEERAEQEEHDRDHGDAWGGGELVDRQNMYIEFLRSVLVWPVSPIHRGYRWALVANAEDAPGVETWSYVLGDLLDAGTQGLLPEGLKPEPWINEFDQGVWVIEF